MRRNVDVTALFLAVGYRDHELRVVHWRPGAVLHHYRPPGMDKARPAVRFAGGQRGCLDPGNVVAVLDVVYTPGRYQGFEVDVLIGITGRILCPVHTSGAVDDPFEIRARPVVPLADQRL